MQSGVVSELQPSATVCLILDFPGSTVQDLCCLQVPWQDVACKCICALATLCSQRFTSVLFANRFTQMMVVVGMAPVLVHVGLTS